MKTTNSASILVANRIFEDLLSTNTKSEYREGCVIYLLQQIFASSGFLFSPLVTHIVVCTLDILPHDPPSTDSFNSWLPKTLFFVYFHRS